jgi:PKD repeat protein
MVCKERISFKCGGQLFLIRFSKLCKTAALLFIFIISHPNISAQDVGFSESDGSGCNPLIITFTNTSDPTNTKGFDWNFGDGSPVESYDETNAGQSVIHTFTAPGNHEVRLTLHPISGTDQIEIHIISIYSIDIPAAQASALVLCNGTVTFTNTSNPDITPGARTTLWDFGDGSTDNNATTTHTFPMTVDSLYRVKMINSNICGFDSTFLDIQVYPINNQIVTDVDPVYCVNNNVAFSNLGHKNNMTYLWDFSDGTTSTLSTPIHEFTLPNTYKITMVTDIGGGQGCHDSITTDLTFLPGPKAGFIATYDTTCNSTNSSFSNTTTGPNDSWDWDFGNGQNFLGENPSGSYHYGVPGNYPVMLIATNTANGCSDTSTQFIFVPSYPVASFTCTNVCLGKDALFFDASVTGAITPILIWSWDFNGEQTSIIANPSIVFNTPGQKQVILDVATHYCSDDTLITVVVEDIPHISFTPSDTIGCAPLPVAFNNSTTLAMSYHWIFGDSYTDTATSPIHQFNTLPLTDTTYTTKLYASTAFGCIDSAIQNITVLFTPDAQFISDASITPVCTIDTVLFTSTTMGASQLEWDFGDGTHGSDSVEVHEYQNSNPFFKHFEINLICHHVSKAPL